METIINVNIIVMILGGAIIMGIVNFVKVKFPKINSQIVVAIIALVLGVLYQLFANYVPVGMRESIINFALSSGATAVLLYEFFWKNFFVKK